jgi:hypothetical protein
MAAGTLGNVGAAARATRICSADSQRQVIDEGAIPAPDRTGFDHAGVVRSAGGDQRGSPGKWLVDVGRIKPQRGLCFDATHGRVCRLRDAIARLDDSPCLHVTT